MQQISLPNGGSWSQAFHAQTAETGDENATLLAHDRIVLGRKLWQVSRLIRTSCIQRCRSFSKRVGPRVIFLKASQVSSCSKRCCEITTLTEQIVVLTKIDSQWLHVVSVVIIQNVVVKSYCNKMNKIRKRLWTCSFAQNLMISKFLKTFGNLRDVNKTSRV